MRTASLCLAINAAALSIRATSSEYFQKGRRRILKTARSAALAHCCRCQGSGACNKGSSKECFDVPGGRSATL